MTKCFHLLKLKSEYRTLEHIRTSQTIYLFNCCMLCSLSSRDLRAILQPATRWTISRYTTITFFHLWNTISLLSAKKKQKKTWLIVTFWLCFAQFVTTAITAVMLKKNKKNLEYTPFMHMPTKKLLSNKSNLKRKPPSGRSTANVDCAHRELQAKHKICDTVTSQEGTKCTNNS